MHTLTFIPSVLINLLYKHMYHEQKFTVISRKTLLGPHF